MYAVKTTLYGHYLQATRSLCNDQGKIQRCHYNKKKSGFFGHFLLCVFSSDGISMISISGHLSSSGELSRQDKQVEEGVGLG